jgi:quinone-modifying oxidoreductase subunit QmoC
MADRQLIVPDSAFIKSIRKAGGDTLKKCYQCATCSVVCKLSTDESPFPRQEMFLAQWGLKDRILRDPNVWACHQCNDCSIHCPRGARPGDVLAAVRAYTFENFSFPKFMGKALASPAALPLLLLVPALVLLGLMYISAPTTPTGEFMFMQAGVPIDFNFFLPHSTIDAFFVFGMILIFIFAAVGFLRFWRMLNSNVDSDISFVKGLILTVQEILTHSKFFKCGANKPRAIAHYLVLGGFVSAMIATAMVFVLIFIPHYIDLPSLWNLPLELPNPVKIFGALGGIGLLTGGGILIYRRWTDRDGVGANGYVDYLFLYIIFLTGLTGMMSWIGRSYIAYATFAYISYFIHLVLVFFLLWYMPYSKFAHMIYRTLALIYVNGGGKRS